MRIKVISDGTIPGTEVINEDTGRKITNILAVRMNLDVDEIIPTVWLKLCLVEDDADAILVNTEINNLNFKDLDDLGDERKLMIE